jgi:hypothetical protein
LTTFKDPKPKQLGALLNDLTKAGRSYDEAFDFLRKMNENGLSRKFDELYAKKQEGFIIVGQRRPQPEGLSHEFEIRDGKIRFKDLSKNKEVYARYEFVITADGELRIGAGHFYLADNEDYVRAAGAIGLERGKIVMIWNQSGHYQPMNQELLDAINKHLKSKEYVAPDLDFVRRGGR